MFTVDYGEYLINRSIVACHCILTRHSWYKERIGYLLTYSVALVRKRNVKNINEDRLVVI
jgi:hypothetical protein